MRMVREEGGHAESPYRERRGMITRRTWRIEYFIVDHFSIQVENPIQACKHPIPCKLQDKTTLDSRNKDAALGTQVLSRCY